MAKRIIKNYPSPRLMETIGATNQRPAEAIGELVANSFDARIDDKKIKIVVDLRDDKIKVIDNGKGMNFDVLEKAVCIAEDMSKYIERGEGAKGHFGMGFKTSCSTLGYYYEIYTRPQKENKEYHVGFDIKDYSNRPSGADAWDIEIEEEQPSNLSPLEDMLCGTAFVISKLKVKLDNVGAILDYLGNAFKGHIKTGDTILLIDSEGNKYNAQPSRYNIYEESKVDIDLEFDFEHCKYNITGWVGLDKETHNDGIYGFNIYRHGQLVESWNKDWFRAHLMTSRIIGEVNMDFLDATFYKQGTQQSELWKIASKKMNEFLDQGIIKASRDISRAGNSRNVTELKRIFNTLGVDYNIETNDCEMEIYTPTSDLKSIKRKEGINESIKTIIKEKELILNGQEKITITYIETEKNRNIEVPFDYIYSAPFDNENSELQVTRYKNHPLWSKKIDDEVVKILAISDSIYRVLVEKLNRNCNEALSIRNKWLNERLEVKKGE